MTEMMLISRADLCAMIAQVRQETMQDVIAAAKEFAGITKPSLYTREDVAQMFKVDARTISRWDDMLPADNLPIKAGNSVRYDETHIAFFKAIRKMPSRDALQSENK